MLSVSQLNNFGRQYYYLFNFCGLIGRYIVLYFLPKKPLLKPDNHKIRGSVGSQDEAYFHWSCLQVCVGCRPIFIHQWLISFMFLDTWNPPFKRGFHRMTNHADDKNKTADQFDFDKIFSQYHLFVKLAD